MICNLFIEYSSAWNPLKISRSIAWYTLARSKGFQWHARTLPCGCGSTDWAYLSDLSLSHVQFKLSWNCPRDSKGNFRLVRATKITSWAAATCFFGAEFAGSWTITCRWMSCFPAGSSTCHVRGKHFGGNQDSWVRVHLEVEARGRQPKFLEIFGRFHPKSHPPKLRRVREYCFSGAPSFQRSLLVILVIFFHCQVWLTKAATLIPSNQFSKLLKGDVQKAIKSQTEGPKLGNAF